MQLLKAAVLRRIVEIRVDESAPHSRPGGPPPSEEPLSIEEVPEPMIGHGQVLVEVSACGICYTDIDIIEGRLHCKLPTIPGHQIVGRVVEVGKGVEGVGIGDRVGIAWIGHTCGKCYYCKTSQENLCENFLATGCNIDGGYADLTVAYGGYVYPIPKGIDDESAAPLLCAGAVGYRALKLANMADGLRLGLFGFGSSAHIVIQIARRLYPSSEIYVFTRSPQHQELAKRLGADWVGHPAEDPPKGVDRAIDFTPVGETVRRALEVLNRGGRLVVNVIRKQTPVELDYAKHVWLEKELKSVANVTRRDVIEFLDIVGRYGVEVQVQVYRFSDVNKALRELKSARVRGSPVLRIR